MKPLRILIAEDNDDHAELIMDVLEESSCPSVVERKVNGRDLLDYIELLAAAGPNVPLPELILLDIKMPLVNGISALEHLKKHPTLKKIPVIMLSTSANAEEVERCYGLGANSYIVKPFDHTEFEHKLRNLRGYWSETTLLPQIATGAENDKPGGD